MNSDLYKGRRLILAPMAGVSDEIFRQICIEMGAQLTYTEMVSAKALSYGNSKTRDLLALAPNEDKVVVQLFGHEPETMAQEAYVLEQAMGDTIFSIDINMGCPARKIAGKGDGAALMRDPLLAGKIVEAIARKVSVPVTVKMRRGFQMDHETAPELAHIVEESGACAIAVHGRYAQQFYQGSACWDTIIRVKEAVSVPVVGNGDITSAIAAKKMIDHTQCDAIMVGRAAEGNPWIFKQIAAYLEYGELEALPKADERIAVALKHARILADQFDNNIVKMRKHAMWYLHGMRGASSARRAINDAVTYEDFERIFNEVFAMQEPNSGDMINESMVH